MIEQKAVAEIEERVQSLKGLIIFLSAEKKKYHHESRYESYVRDILKNVLKKNAKELARLVRELKKIKGEAQKPEEPLIREIVEGYLNAPGKDDSIILD